MNHSKISKTNLFNLLELIDSVSSGDIKTDPLDDEFYLTLISEDEEPVRIHLLNKEDEEASKRMRKRKSITTTPL